MKHAITFTLALVLALEPRAALAQNSPPAQACINAGCQKVGSSAIADKPAITITTAAANSTVSPTQAATTAHIQWKFGTVVGTYTTCTVQLQTAIDALNAASPTWLALGTPVAVTVTSSTVNAWSVYAAVPTSGSTVTGSVSATAVQGFGPQSRFAFACSGAYGTSAPVTISATYK